jgi:hypothetical protein
MKDRSSRMPSRRWWAALAVALSALIVARTNTVDAPADAMMADLAGSDAPSSVEAERGGAGFTLPSPGAGFTLPSPGGASDGDSSRYLWTLESEIRALESELAVERARAELLQESYSALESKFMRLTAALPLMDGPAAAPEAQPLSTDAELRAGAPRQPQVQPTPPSVLDGSQRSGLQRERKPR